MNFRRISEDLIEIDPGGEPRRKVLVEMARLSYETSDSPLPWFIHPFEVPASHMFFSDLVTDEGLRMDYLNGKLCSTHVEIRGNRLLFDAKRFRQDRGAPEAFLKLLEQRLESE
jgi:hypothetical protein